jgi:hypothetical protein
LIQKKILKRGKRLKIYLLPKPKSDGRSSDFRIDLLPAPSRLAWQRASGNLRVLSPNTAAGPYRIGTGFPIIPKTVYKLPSFARELRYNSLQNTHVLSCTLRFRSKLRLAPKQNLSISKQFYLERNHQIFDFNF